MTDEPTIRASGLAKRYVIGGGGRRTPLRRKPRKATKPRREVWALQDATFEVHAGTILGVVGRNGAGKTTLLKILARVTPPTKGTAEIRGRVVPLLELGTGFQPHSTGRENVLLHANLYGIPRAEVLERFDDLVAFAELEQAIDRPVGKYSSGMYLRLAFAVAITMRPDVLLADEVLAVGDVSFQQRCLERVREEGERGMTVLFVSHDGDAVRDVCDRAVWLDDGKVVADGDPDEVVTAYEQSALAPERRNWSKRSPTDEVGSMVEFRVMGDADAQRTDEEFVVAIGVDLARAGLALRCKLVVLRGATVVFRAAMPAAMEVVSPGRHRFEVRVPAHLLAEGVYELRAAVRFTEGEDAYGLAADPIQLRIEQAHGPHTARGDYDGNLDGVVQPRLEWAVTARPEDPERRDADSAPSGP